VWAIIYAMYAQRRVYKQ